VDPSFTDQRPFGIPNSPLGPSFVVLDKSFLDALSPAQLQYHAQQGIIFGVTDVLMFELMRKPGDDHRKRSLFKLSEVQGLVLLPGAGEMFRAESKFRRPAPSVLRARRLEITPSSDSNGPFPMTPAETRATEQRTADLRTKGHKILKVWRDFGSMPLLREASSTELPEKFDALKREILENRDSMRQFYANHTEAPLPAAQLIDERWACFRWIQVYLLAGVEFFGRHGLNSEPNQEKMLNELLDLDYTITAILAGGIASCDKTIRDRFRFLRPDGFILHSPF